MNTKLTEQKRLMQKGVDILQSIERLEKISGHLDDEYVKQETASYGAEYAEVIKTLVAGCLKDSGMVLKELPENKLAAIA